MDVAYAIWEILSTLSFLAVAILAVFIFIAAMLYGVN